MGMRQNGFSSTSTVASKQMKSLSIVDDDDDDELMTLMSKNECTRVPMKSAHKSKQKSLASGTLKSNATNVCQSSLRMPKASVVICCLNLQSITL